MLRYGWLQFKRSKNIWLTAIFIFMMTGWLVGFCFSGIVALSILGPQAIDPLPLFVSPIVFGGFTLFFMLKGIIKEVVQESADEYRLWAVLGTDVSQISFLVGIQTCIVAFIGTTIGFLLARISLQPIYHLLQSWLGSKWLPSISFSRPLLVFVLTVLTISLLTFIGGYLNGGRLIFNNRVKFRSLKLIVKVIFVLGLIFQFIKIYIQILQGNINQESKMNLLFSTVFLLILIESIAGRGFLKVVFRLIFPPILFKKSPIFNLARWNVNYHLDKMTNIIVPMLIVENIILFFYEIMYRMPDLANTILSFIVYVFAPLIIVIANLITLTLLKERQQSVQVKQLRILGMNLNEIVRVKVGESLIYALLLLFVSLISNFIMAIGLNAGLDLLIEMRWMFVIIPIVLSLIAGLLLSVTSYIYTTKQASSELQMKLE